jgi:hypothetical protein
MNMDISQVVEALIYLSISLSCYSAPNHKQMRESC